MGKSKEFKSGISDSYQKKYNKFFKRERPISPFYPVLDNDLARDNIENDFRENLGINLVIHMDPIDTKDENTQELREEAFRILQSIDTKLNFHDFRVVKGETHTNVLFDVLVPVRYNKTDKELKTLIDQKFKEYDPKINTVLVIDHDYNGTK